MDTQTNNGIPIPKNGVVARYIQDGPYVIQKYTPKTIETIEAVQWNGDNTDEVRRLYAFDCDVVEYKQYNTKILLIGILGQVLKVANITDYVVAKDMTIYVMTQKDFEEWYERCQNIPHN